MTTPTASSISVGVVPSLDHVVWDDTVELGAFVSEAFPIGKGNKVFDSYWHSFSK